MSQAAQVISLLTGPFGQCPTKETKSSAIVTPGFLIEPLAGTVAAHATAAGNAQKLFALPNLAVAGSIDTDYASGDTVRFGAFHAGQEVNALVAAAAPAILEGDALESAGNGTLRKLVVAAATAQSARDSVVGYALAALDNSGGGTSARLAIRVA